MTLHAGPSSALHVLLIGIDFYYPGFLADGRTRYPSLRGCVRDISHVEDFLRTQLRVPGEQITRLSATNLGSATQLEPPEPREAWPTYENMIGSFDRVLATAQSGDRVYVHYSGHGGRAPTLVPSQKGRDGLDESLVPFDIHHAGARYLRDVELAVIFKRMVDKGLNLSVVLDSCHSGGAVRGVADVAVRGLGAVDNTPRRAESMVASKQDLANTWAALMTGVTRDVALSSGWLPEPRGYVLLAACTATESAYEYAFDGVERNGVLTYWLLDTLRTHGPNMSYKLLYDRILARVHSQFQYQTPQLQGQGQNTFLGAAGVAPQPSVVVLEVDAAGNRVRLATGQVAGMRRGAQFAIYPYGTTAVLDSTGRLAIATLTDLGAASSWAEVSPVSAGSLIEPGAPAMLVDPSRAKLRLKVGFAHRNDLAPDIDQDAALGAVRQAMAANPWVAEATPDDTLEYQVAINERGEYELWDPSGVSIPRLHPPLVTGHSDAAASLVRRLIHLARYHAVEQLINRDALSSLHGKLSLELIGAQDDYDPALDSPRPEPFRESGGLPVVEDGQTAFLRIRNHASQTLKVAVLNLQPDWGVTQVFPSGIGDQFHPIEPDREETIDLRASLPSGYAECRDQLKAFATLEPVNFRVLELPTLDQPIGRANAKRGVPATPKPNPLQELLETLTADPPAGQPVSRNVSMTGLPGHEWTTAQVELRVVPRNVAPTHPS